MRGIPPQMDEADDDGDRRPVASAGSRAASRGQRWLPETALIGRGEAVIGRDRAGRICAWNAMAERLYGYPAHEVMGAPYAVLHSGPGELAIADGDASLDAPGDRGDESGRRIRVGVEHRTRGGEPIIVDLEVLAVVDAEGAPAGALTIVRPLHLDGSSRPLQPPSRALEDAVQQAPLGAALVSVDRVPGRILLVNRALCALAGRDRGELEGREFAELLHPDDVRSDLEAMAHLLAGRSDTLQLEQRLLRPDHRAVWVMSNLAVVRDGSGGPLHCIRQFEDIEARRRSEGELGYLADHDPLTGLVNRRGFVRELDRLLAHVRRYGGPATILFVDLDDFKSVNDRFGHRVGDEVIVAAGRVVADRLRETDVVARLGGDEFAALLPHAGAEEARRLAGDLLEAIRETGRTVLEAHGGGRLSASIGVTVLEDHVGGYSGEDLLRDADLAMYGAKDDGKDRVRVTRPGDLGGASRLSVPDRIRRAVGENALMLHGQPVVDLRSGETGLWELLLRLPEIGGEATLPSQFLHGAARTGLSLPVDRWVLEHAVDLLAGREPPESGTNPGAAPALVVSVNLSGAAIGDVGLSDHLNEILSDHRVEPARLVLEVAERTVLADVERARRFVARIRAIGCGLALDDFGAGFGSYHYLRHLSFDYVKIEGELVEHLVGSRPDQLILDSMVQLCRSLGARTIGKSAADGPTVAMLERHGVDFAQGFHLGRPRPVEALLQARWPGPWDP